MSAKICVQPGMLWGEPHVEGRRLGALFIAKYHWLGITDGYDLTRDQILVACWFAVRHGTPTWRKRWKRWLKDNEDALWARDEWADVPLPPTATDAA